AGIEILLFWDAPVVGRLGHRGHARPLPLLLSWRQGLPGTVSRHRAQRFVVGVDVLVRVQWLVWRLWLASAHSTVPTIKRLLLVRSLVAQLHLPSSSSLIPEFGWREGDLPI